MASILREAYPSVEKFDPSNDRFLRGIIRKKANQLVHHAGFTHQDRKVIEQDLSLKVLQSMPQFDPKRSHFKQFIATVVERHVATILRDKKAQKRDCRGVRSLNEIVDNSEDGPIELAETISTSDHDKRLGRKLRSDTDLADMCLDVAVVIGSLPEKLLELAEYLKTDSISEISRRTGVPRTTLNERLKKLRQLFEDKSLQEYL